MKTRKAYTLSDDCLAIIDQVAEEMHSYKTEALEYIIRQYEIQKIKSFSESDWANEFADLLIKKFDEKYRSLHTRLRMGVGTAEFNSEVILNAVNMILYHDRIKENYLIEHVKMPVIENSEKTIRKRLAHFKQKKDDSGGR